MEHLLGQVQEVTGELVTAANALGGTTVLGLVGGDPDALLPQVRLQGVAEIVTVRTPTTEFDGDTYRQAVEALVHDLHPDVVLMGFTVNSIGYGSAVAARLGMGLASDVFAITAQGDTIAVQRPFYGGKIVGELEFAGAGGVVLLLRRGVWAPAAAGAAGAAVRNVEVALQPARTRHLEFAEAKSADEVDIASADFLLCVGRGIGEKENLERFERLADKLGATLAVSRPLVDAGWAPRARQVGQSGKTVKPKVYLSLGVSGAIQHLAGMKNSGLIISVNKDPEASIFGVAHYGAVIDLFELADELEKRCG
ncbi:MAG: electron transfer flavoprotein subunit alpha/FixB family protein [Dehalococcoidia bacterium]